MATAEKSRVDGDEVLRLLKAGKNASEVGKMLGVSGQAIRHRRQNLIKEGVLPTNTGGNQGKRTKINLRPQPKPDLSLDTGVESLIKMAELATKAHQLEIENWELKNKLATAKTTVEALQKRDKNEKDQRLRFRVAQQQGEIPSNLTEDISCAPLFLVSAFNINKPDLVFCN